MIPILYDEQETIFDSNGLGRLSDCISCEVTEERNGKYELELIYPIIGHHSESLELGNIILARTTMKNERTQPFEIVSVVKNMNNVITVFAVHISYRMSYIPVKNITNTSSVTAKAAINLINNNVVGLNPFTLKTDKADKAVFHMDVPHSLKAMMLGEEGSLLDCYGGTWEYDHFTATLKGQRGEQTDVVIRYGKDLEELTYGGSREDIYIGILPYWKGSYTPEGQSDQVEVVVIPDEPVVTNFAKNLAYSKNIVVDVSSEFETEEFENYPSKAQVTEKGIEYAKRNITGSEETTLEISFKTVERAGKDKMAGLGLCDEVTVIHNPFNLSATGKIVKTVYDVLLDRYKTVEIGLVKPNIVDYIAGDKK